MQYRELNYFKYKQKRLRESKYGIGNGAAVVAVATVALVGIIVASYLAGYSYSGIDYTSNWIDEVSSDQQLVELLIEHIKKCYPLTVHAPQLSYLSPLVPDHLYIKNQL